MSINNDAPEGSTGREEQAKYAGHLIYNSLHNEPAVLAPVIPPPVESVENGVMDSNVAYSFQNQGKMSSVRRTFCLFVTFDLILMFILWVIYTQLIGDTGYKAFERQVKEYSFKGSLFDTVELSAVRFVFLLLAYALFKIKHWWMVALTTALTCAVLIAKIFIFDFKGNDSNDNNPLSYCLIIISFVLAWAETWFLDFKVLPHEKKVEMRLAQAMGRGYGSTSVVGTGYRRLRGDDMMSAITEDNQFYSPMDSPAGSDVEEDGHRDHDFRSVASSRRTTGQENDYSRLAKHAWGVLVSYTRTPESEWKLETGNDMDTGIVHSMKVKGVGKIFRLQAIVNIPAKDLYEELTFKPETQPTWNLSVSECKVLQVVNENTDVLYTIASEIAGGVISSRDFVNVRHWGEVDGMYLGAGMAVNHPDKPPQKNHVRGINGAGGWVFRSAEGEADKCFFSWYMNTDIKGWFPQKLIDANMSKVLMEFVGFLRNHIADITAS